MLPSILDVADDQGLECVERTRSKKEVYYRCPFCHHHNPKLSLNPAKNVFKCWHCGESGGVLEFEAKLTGKTFTEVKQQYFPYKSKSSPNAKQRQKLGHTSIPKDTYKKQITKLKTEWETYQFFMCRKYFAYLSVILLIDDDVRRNELVAWWYEEVRRTEIPLLASTLIGGMQQDARWQQEGQLLADMAFSVCKETGDFELLDIVKNVSFLLFYTLVDEKDLWQRGQFQTKFGHALNVKIQTEARFFL